MAEFAVGARVVVHGLTTTGEQYNGSHGVVRSALEDGRHTVRLDAPHDKELCIKIVNLKEEKRILTDIGFQRAKITNGLEMLSIFQRLLREPEGAAVKYSVFQRFIRGVGTASKSVTDVARKQMTIAPAEGKMTTLYEARQAARAALGPTGDGGERKFYGGPTPNTKDAAKDSKPADGKLAWVRDVKALGHVAVATLSGSGKITMRGAKHAAAEAAARAAEKRAAVEAAARTAAKIKASLPLTQARVEVSLSIRLPPSFIKREKTAAEKQQDKKEIKEGLKAAENNRSYTIDTSARKLFELSLRADIAGAARLPLQRVVIEEIVTLAEGLDPGRLKKVVKALKALSKAPTSGDAYPGEEKDEGGVPIDDVLYGLNKQEGLLGSPFSRAELSRILAHLTDEGRVFMAGEHVVVRTLPRTSTDRPSSVGAPHAPENADDAEMAPELAEDLDELRESDEGESEDDGDYSDAEEYSEMSPTPEIEDEPQPDESAPAENERPKTKVRTSKPRRPLTVMELQGRGGAARGAFANLDIDDDDNISHLSSLELERKVELSKRQLPSVREAAQERAQRKELKRRKQRLGWTPIGTNRVLAKVMLIDEEDEAGAVVVKAKAVASAACDERSPLRQAGEVMCCATSALAYDLSSTALFEQSEKYWCYVISPVFFGYSTSKLLSKREKQQGDEFLFGGKFYETTVTPFPAPTDEEEAEAEIAAKAAKEAKRSSTLSTTQQIMNRRVKKSDASATGALVVPTPIDEEELDAQDLPKSYKELEIMLVQAEMNLKSKMARGLVQGLDGLEHMTPPQLVALRRRDHCRQKLEMMRKYHDVKKHNLAQQGEPEWWRQPRRVKKQFSMSEVKAWDNEDTEDRIATRQATIFKKAKAKIHRKHTSEQRDREYRIRGWLMGKLINFNPNADKFHKAHAQVMNESSALEQKLQSDKQGEVTQAEIERGNARRSAKKQMRKRIDALLRELHRKLYKRLHPNETKDEGDVPSAVQIMMENDTFHQFHAVTAVAEDSKKKDRTIPKKYLFRKIVPINTDFGDWARKVPQKYALAPICTLPEFAQAFLLQPVGQRGMITEQELVLFGLAVSDVAEKYTKMKTIVADMVERERLEKSSFKAKKKMEAEAKAKRKEALEARVAEKKAKDDPSLLQETRAQLWQRWRDELAERPEAWALFHQHVIINLVPNATQFRTTMRCTPGVQNAKRVPPSQAELATYCVVCRRRQWEAKRRERTALEKAWVEGWDAHMEQKAKDLEKEIRAAVELKQVDRRYRELSQIQRDNIRDVLDDAIIEIETRNHDELHDQDTVKAVVHAMVDAIALTPVKAELHRAADELEMARLKCRSVWTRVVDDDETHEFFVDESEAEGGALSKAKPPKGKSALAKHGWQRRFDKAYAVSGTEEYFHPHSGTRSTELPEVLQQPLPKLDNMASLASEDSESVVSLVETSAAVVPPADAPTPSASDKKAVEKGGAAASNGRAIGRRGSRDIARRLSGLSVEEVEIAPPLPPVSSDDIQTLYNSTSCALLKETPSLCSQWLAQRKAEMREEAYYLKRHEHRAIPRSQAHDHITRQQVRRGNYHRQAPKRFGLAMKILRRTKVHTADGWARAEHDLLLELFATHRVGAQAAARALKKAADTKSVVAEGSAAATTTRVGMSDGAPPDHAAIAPLVEADTGPLSSGTSVERGQGVYDPRLPRSRATAFLPDDLRAEFAKRTLAEEYEFQFSQIALKKPIRRKKKSEIDFEIALANQQRKREEAAAAARTKAEDDINTADLRIDVYDWDKGGDDTKLGDFLGHARFSVAQLTEPAEGEIELILLDKPTNKPDARPATPDKPPTPDKPQEKPQEKPQRPRFSLFSGSAAAKSAAAKSAAAKSAAAKSVATSDDSTSATPQTPQTPAPAPDAAPLISRGKLYVELLVMKRCSIDQKSEAFRKGPCPPVQWRLRIIRASGLRKADLFGQSDPYCVVTWNGTELGRTEHIDDTREPFWGGMENMNAEFTVTAASSLSAKRLAFGKKSGVFSLKKSDEEKSDGSTFGLKMSMKKAMLGAKIAGATAASSEKLAEQIDKTLEARRAEVEREEMERRMLEQEENRQQR